MSATKNDLLISAFEEIRISGITVNPTPADKALALRHLETMMAQLEGRNICVGYNFEDTPNMNSLSNVDRAYWYPIIMLLADRLLPSFGKVATPEFARNRSGAQSYLSSVCAKLHPVRILHECLKLLVQIFILYLIQGQHLTVPLTQCI
jgi:hypothetical protein